jgi:phosphatidate cytidylyltransferase
VSAGHSSEHLRVRRAGTEWPLRLLSGFALAVVAVSAVALQPEIMAALLALMCLFAAREWHRMVRTVPPPRGMTHLQTAVTGLAIAAAIAATLWQAAWAGFLLLVAGAAAAFLLARQRGDNAPWHALGVLYIGVPALALMALRLVSGLNGSLVVMGLFLIVWSTDTGALLVGRLVGGPKLAPAISPGKTWAGTIGGSVAAALVYGLYIAMIGQAAAPAALFALVFSIAAHLGDLLESVFKRRFGTKDTGGLIPGHGGALDRMDSTLVAAPVLAVLVFALGFNPLFGGPW